MSARFRLTWTMAIWIKRVWPNEVTCSWPASTRHCKGPRGHLALDTGWDWLNSSAATGRRHRRVGKGGGTARRHNKTYRAPCPPGESMGAAKPMVGTAHDRLCRVESPK